MAQFLTVTIKNDQGVEIGTFIATPKTFSTGSTGFNLSAKVTDTDGAKYQIGANIVKIGSKPASN